MSSSEFMRARFDALSDGEVWKVARSSLPTRNTVNGIVERYKVRHRVRISALWFQQFVYFVRIEDAKATKPQD